MNQKLPLENAGDSATFTITEVRAVSTKFGNKIVFVGTDDSGAAVETPLISDATADKQLERIGLDRDSAVGERLTFSRAPNPSGKPYWNLDVPKAGAAPTKRMVPQAVPQTQGNATLDQRRDKVLAQYLLLWETVAKQMHSVCDQANITLDAAAIQSAAATVWISWKDKGIQPDGLDAVKVSQPEPAPEVKMPAPSGKRLAPPQNITVPPARPEDDDLPF